MDEHPLDRLEQEIEEERENNSDLDELLKEIGGIVMTSGAHLAKRRRKATPYDRFTLEELKDIQKTLKNCSVALKEVRLTYKMRYSE